MEKGVIRDPEHDPESCRPVTEILSRVGDKWSGQILAALGDKRMRFKELHRAVDGISQRMLTVSLRHLERDGLLVRTVYPTVPPRVEYELSDRGWSLKTVLQPIAEWAQANRKDIEESRRRFDGQAQPEAAATLIRW